MRIVNVKKFLRMILLIIGIVIAICFCFSNKAYSRGETSEKTIYVANGDTLWSIAANEQEKNSYYLDKDIRDIIYEIKKLNNLENNNLSIGQKLIIKVM